MSRPSANRPAIQAVVVLTILVATGVTAWLLHAHDDRAARRTSAAQVRHALSVIGQTVNPPLRDLAQVGRTVGLLRLDVRDRWPALVEDAMQEPALAGTGFVRRGRPDRHGHVPLVIERALIRTGASVNQGQDVSADPARVQAMLAAERTGTLQATRPVPFLGDLRGRTGVLFYVPAFRPHRPVRTPAQRRTALVGWVFGAYDMQSVAMTLNHRLPEGVRLDLSDGPLPISSQPGPSPGGGAHRTFPFAGRTWQVVVHVPRADHGRWPLIIIAIGISLAALVALAFLLDRRREVYALTLVDERMAERDAVEATLRVERDRTGALMRSIADGVMTLAPDGRVTDVNDGFCAMVGIPRAALLGARAPFPFWPPEEVETLHAVTAALAAGQEQNCELRFMHPDGRRIPVLFSGALARDRAGEPIGFVCTAKDISERKRYEERLADLAARDALTGLLNHRSFQEHLHVEVARVHRHEDRNLSLVILDLDRFKCVNDALGHPVGDRVLAEAADRLRSVVRDGEWLARTGGEEFAWILPDAGGVQAYAAAERARHAIERAPFGDAGTLTISAGVCDLSEAATADDLYRLADVALYWAKSHGRNMTFRYSAAVAGELGTAESPAEAERRQTVRTLHQIAAVVEARDVSTTGHTDRVAALVHRLAIAAGWPSERADRLREAALLHDVGKVAVRAEVLSKPGRLTEEEYEHVKTHSAIGARMVASVLDDEQTSWVRGHHERWDGRGYPDGLAGEALSEGGALLAMADAFDAMTSPRAYKPAMTQAGALEEARAGCGTQFAPFAVRLLDRVLKGRDPQIAQSRAPVD